MVDLWWKFIIYFDYCKENLKTKKIEVKIPQYMYIIFNDNNEKEFVKDENPKN